MIDKIRDQFKKSLFGDLTPRGLSILSTRVQPVDYSYFVVDVKDLIRCNPPRWYFRVSVIFYCAASIEHDEYSAVVAHHAAAA